MSNREIRARAWALCKANFGKILAASLLVNLIPALVSALLSGVGLDVAGSSGGNLMGATLGLQSLATILNFILTMYLTVGFMFFIVKILHEEPAGIGAMFGHGRKVWTYLAITLLMVLILCGIALCILPITLISLMLPEIPAMIATLVGSVALIVLEIWVALRLEMSLTCMVLRPQLGSGGCIGLSWRASKGHLGRLFCNTFVLNLPLWIALALITGFEFYSTLILHRTLTPIASIVLNIATMLITALFSGYINLGTLGLHEHLLDAYDGGMLSVMPAPGGSYPLQDAPAADALRPELPAPEKTDASDEDDHIV